MVLLEKPIKNITFQTEKYLSHELAGVLRLFEEGRLHDQ